MARRQMTKHYERHNMTKTKSMQDKCFIPYRNRTEDGLSKLFFSLFGESFMWMLLFLWKGKGVFISLFAFFVLPLVFGKRYRFSKLAAVAWCDIPAVFPQVWASSFLPNEPTLAERCQREYKQQHGEPMLLQYARMEAQAQVTQHR